MRKNIYVALLCMMFLAVFLRQGIKAQTPEFKKLDPKMNQRLWSPTYADSYTFKWAPYTGTFTSYILKIHSALTDGTVIKQFPLTSNITSKTINFTTDIVPNLIHDRNKWYYWSIGAYNGTALVAEADSSTNSTRFAFSLPLYVAAKTWTINASVKCPPNTVLARNVRPFWTAWEEFQNLRPWEFLWHFGQYKKGYNTTQFSQSITNRTANDGLYFGLESDLVVTKKLYYTGYTSEPLELIPTGLPWGSNMDQPIIYQGTWFNPYTAMTHWYREKLPSGSYSVAFAIPTPYVQQWCLSPTPTSRPTATPTLAPFQKVSPANTSSLSYGYSTFSWTRSVSSTNSLQYYTLGILDNAGSVLKRFNYYESVPGTGNISMRVFLPSVNGLQPGQTYKWTVWYSNGSPAQIEADNGTRWQFSIAPATKLSCIIPTADAYVQENSKTSNYGSSAQVRAGTIYQTTWPTPAPTPYTNIYFYLSYFKFNPAQFPTQYDIAVFRVFQSGSDGAAGGLPVYLNKAGGAWTESTLNWNNKPGILSGDYGSQEIGGWNNNNTWYTWDVTSMLKNTTVENGLVLRDSRYTSSCENSTSPSCRAGAGRAGYLNSREAAANKPEICFYSIGPVTPTVPVCVKSNGDADCLNGVNDTDYAIWKCEYLNGGVCPSPSSNKSADFNNSGTVDLVDFEIWRSHRFIP